jgi:hypothetical protein
MFTTSLWILVFMAFWGHKIPELVSNLLTNFLHNYLRTKLMCTCTWMILITSLWILVFMAFRGHKIQELVSKLLDNFYSVVQRSIIKNSRTLFGRKCFSKSFWHLDQLFQSVLGFLERVSVGADKVSIVEDLQAKFQLVGQLNLDYSCQWFSWGPFLTSPLAPRGKNLSPRGNIHPFVYPRGEHSTV